MRNKKGRYEYHNYKKRRKAKEPSETRADVLAALEQQRKKEAERSPSIEQSSVPKPIPGFFFDQEKQKYFPLSMKRDSVYVGFVPFVEKKDKPLTIPSSPFSYEKSRFLFVSTVLQSKRLRGPSSLSNLYKSLLLSPRNSSIVLSPPNCVVHGVSLVENTVIVSSKSKLFLYRIIGNHNNHKNDLEIASIPSILQLTTEIDISWQHHDVFVCNSRDQSYLFYLSTHTQIPIRPSRCCYRLSPSVVISGGDEGVHVYENDLLTQTISTPSSVLAITSSSSSLPPFSITNSSIFFIGCRDGSVYRWVVGSHDLQWWCRCRHAIVSIAAIDEYVCIVDAGGAVKLNKSLVGIRGAQCVCRDETHFIVALKNEIVCLDCTGAVFSSLPLRDIRFLLCTDSFILASDTSQVHIQSKPGHSIQSMDSM